MTSIYLLLSITGTLYALHVGSAYVIWHHPYSIQFAREKEVLLVEVYRVGKQENAPKLDIQISGDPEALTWNTQLRYTIRVSDEKDGDSRYGEIDPRACLLEIEYLPVREEREVRERIERSPVKQEHKGLSFMKQSTCFGCHADKTRLAGPSFLEIAGRYENNPGTLKDLGARIIAGSSGIWGSQTMPSHPDFTLEEATQIAEYILEQGGNKNRWIYPGLEGSFRIIAKPENQEQGVYILTASYTSSLNIRGQQSVVFKIK